MATDTNPMPEDLDVVEPEGGDAIVLLAPELDGDGGPTLCRLNRSPTFLPPP